MEFDRLLDHFGPDTGQKEQVALIFYYFEEYCGRDEVNQSDIRSVIKQSRSTISPSSISTYISRLESRNWITSTENDGYRLSNPGKRGVQDLLDEDAIQDHRDEDEYFIDADVDDERYEQLRI